MKDAPCLSNNITWNDCKSALDRHFPPNNTTDILLNQQNKPLTLCIRLHMINCPCRTPMNGWLQSNGQLVFWLARTDTCWCQHQKGWFAASQQHERAKSRRGSLPAIYYTVCANMLQWIWVIWTPAHKDTDLNTLKSAGVFFDPALFRVYKDSWLWSTTRMCSNRRKLIATNKTSM